MAVRRWQREYGILQPHVLTILTFSINLIAAILTFFAASFEKDYNLVSVLIFILMQTILFTFIMDKTIKTKIVPEMAKEFRIKECSDKTEITLREEDFEIKTQYKKTNYFYSEVEACFDEGTFCMIVVDKHAYPLVIPFISLTEGDKDAFRVLLQEKLLDKYERGV
jgi:hypothetical protein